MSKDHTSPILVVEDSPDDFAATLRALRKAGVTNEIRRCHNGDDALDYLYHRGAYAEALEHAGRPCFILLDLNMPGTDGRQVLETIKGDQTLRSIPVIVLTTSWNDTDVRSCYEIGCNSYVQKPVDHGQFVEAVRHLKDYWFSTAMLPRN